MTLERHDTADYGWTANKGRLLCRMYGAQLASSRISHQFFFFYQLFINGLNIQARLKHSVTTLTFRYDINFPARLQHSGTTLIFPHDFNFSARLFHGMTFNFFSRKTQHNNQPGNDLLSRA